MATAAPVKETEKASEQKPVETFRARGVSAAVFANHAKSEGRDITFFKVSLDRAYKDGDEWKHTSSWHHTGHFAGYSPTRRGTEP